MNEKKKNERKRMFDAEFDYWFWDRYPHLHAEITRETLQRQQDMRAAYDFGVASGRNIRELEEKITKWES